MSKFLREDDIVRVESNVYSVSGSNTNCVIVKDGDSCTLVDTGYPGDRDVVLASLEEVGLNARPWPPSWSPTRTTTTSARPSTCAPRTTCRSSCTRTRCRADLVLAGHGPVHHGSGQGGRPDGP